MLSLTPMGFKGWVILEGIQGWVLSFNKNWEKPKVPTLPAQTLRGTSSQSVFRWLQGLARSD